MAAQADAETIAAFRELVDRVVIINAPNNAVEVQVIGRLAALVGANAEMLGGTMVAEARFAPSTEMMMLQMLVAEAARVSPKARAIAPAKL